MDKNAIIEKQINFLQEKMQAAATADEVLRYNDAIANLLLQIERRDAPASVKV